MSRLAIDWTCPACKLGLRDDLLCESCSQLYPSVDGVPVLVRHPQEFIAASRRRALGGMHERASHLEFVDRLSHHVDLPAPARERLRRVARAQFENSRTVVELLDAASWPSSLGEPEHPNLDVGWIAGGIPYLIRDWWCKRELDAAERFVLDSASAALTGCKRGRLLVLGCGAGGMLTRLSTLFAHALGLDLSLALMLALRRLQSGKTLKLEYPVGGDSGTWTKQLELEGDARLNRVSLGVASADSIPLSDASVDCVFTGFLLDVVDDPRAIATEARRVLAPAGLWINYGPSGGMAAPWRFDQHELAAFVEQFGFRVQMSAHHRTTHMDLREFDPHGHHDSHVCYLSIARP